MWIVGDSIVYWAGRQAEREGEPDLGLSASVTWLGRRGLRLPGVSEVIRSHLNTTNATHPVCILIHAGTNDIGRMKKQKLREMEETLSRVRVLSPRSIVIWSEILPRRSYRGFSRQGQPRIERIRLAMNKWARAVCHRSGGTSSVVGHASVRHDRESLYRNDGIHLSE